MSFITEKSIALSEAVVQGSVKAVHECLEQGADPNYLNQDGNTLLNLAMTQDHIDIIKLLVQYGADLKTVEDFERYIIDIKNSDLCKEVLTHIIKYSNDVRLESFLFFLTFGCHHEGSLALEIMKLLFDSGLPFDDYIKDWAFTEMDDEYTPLHRCIQDNRIDFVRIM